MFFYKSLEGSAMEHLVGLDNFKYLSSRKHLAELLMILLLQFLDLQIQSVHFHNRFMRCRIIIGVDETHEPHFVKQLPLLLLQLIKYREETCRFGRCQTCLPRNKLLHLLLKTLGIEALRRLSCQLQRNKYCKYKK